MVVVPEYKMRSNRTLGASSLVAPPDPDRCEDESTRWDGRSTIRGVDAPSVATRFLPVLLARFVRSVRTGAPRYRRLKSGCRGRVRNQLDREPWSEWVSMWDHRPPRAPRVQTRSRTRPRGQTPILVLESLRSISDSIDCGTFMNRQLHGWAGATLHGYIDPSKDRAAGSTSHVEIGGNTSKLVGWSLLTTSDSLTPLMETDQSVFDVITRKGALQIIYITGAHEVVRFKDLEAHLTVTGPTISTRLEELRQEGGLICREFFDEMPPRVEYTLSPTGKALYEHLSTLFVWAADQTETGPQSSDQQQEPSRPCVCCERADTVRSDGDTVWHKTVDGLIDMVAKTYAMEIIVLLGDEGPIRYSGIKDQLDITTDRAVTSRLDSLQEAGLADRQSYNEVPPRVEYSLTSAGHELAERLRPLLEYTGHDI